MAADGGHVEQLVAESEFLKGAHRRERLPRTAVFGRGSRGVLVRFVRQHGQEEGERLSLSGRRCARKGRR